MVCSSCAMFFIIIGLLDLTFACSDGFEPLCRVWRCDCLTAPVSSPPQLSDATPQTFMGSLTFTGHVTVRGDIELGGRLNGFNTSQFVTLGKDNDVLGTGVGILC